MKRTTFTAMFMLLLSITALGQNRESREIADRIRGDAVRSDNRGDARGAREAREAAGRAEHSTPERARQIERDYNRGNPAESRGRGPAGQQ